MTIEEVKQLQSTLEATIAEALNTFSAQTDLTINNLQLDAMTRTQGPTRYVVTTEVKL